MIISSKDSRGSSGRVLLSDFSDRIGIQFTVLASLLGAVLHVVGSRTKKQVLRVYAITNVALVTNLEVIRNWPKVDFPRNPMGLIHGSFGKLQQPISVTVISTRPKPASYGFIDLAPEFLLKGQSLIKPMTALTAKLPVTFRWQTDELFTALLAGFQTSWNYASSIFTCAGAKQRAVAQRRWWDTEALKTVGADSFYSCYVSISHAAYVSIVEGLVRLVRAFTLPVRAVPIITEVEV